MKLTRLAANAGLFAAMTLAFMGCFVVLMGGSVFAAAGDPCLQFRGTLTREAHFVEGLAAPVPLYAAQMMQESGCRAGITAWDNGRGLAQFMDGTTATIVRLYPELGSGDPYNPTWAIRAMIRYDSWLTARVKGIDACQKRAASLKAYNAGLGYVQQGQRASTAPGVWFGVTEYVPTRQNAKNFEYSRLYPRWILLKRQVAYRGWGAYTCQGISP